VFSQYKLIATGIAVLAVFMGGWSSRGWYEDSKYLAQQKAINKAIDAFQAKESEIAKAVNRKLADLKANERTRIIKTQEIVKQPEFVNVCISQGGIDSINSAVRELYSSQYTE
jgi:hypothetical protein